MQGAIDSRTSYRSVPKCDVCQLYSIHDATVQSIKSRYASWNALGFVLRAHHLCSRSRVMCRWETDQIDRGGTCVYDMVDTQVGITRKTNKSLISLLCGPTKRNSSCASLDVDTGRLGKPNRKNPTHPGTQRTRGGTFLGTAPFQRTRFRETCGMVCTVCLVLLILFAEK